MSDYADILSVQRMPQDELEPFIGKSGEDEVSPCILCMRRVFPTSSVKARCNVVAFLRGTCLSHGGNKLVKIEILSIVLAAHLIARWSGMLWQLPIRTCGV